MHSALEAQLKKYLYALLFVTGVAFFVLMHVSSRRASLLVDEPLNYRQVINFVKDGVRAEIVTSQLAGYHATLALIAQAFQNFSVSFVRFATFLLSVLSIGAFYMLAREAGGGNPFRKTLQYAFFAIQFPFYFLIYSDVFSSLAVLAAVYFLFQRRYTLSALAAAYSVVIRQNNLVWLVFIMLSILLHEYRFTMRVTAVKNAANNALDVSLDARGSGSVVEYLKDCWLFIAAGFCFAAFFFVNKSFVLTDQQAHPSFTFHLGNIYFMLFLFFFLFLPLNIANARRVLALVRSKKRVAAGVALFFIISFALYKVDHIYNLLRPEYYLRNRFLIFTATHMLARLLYFSVVAYAALSLAVTGLARRRYALIYPFCVLYVAPLWLIDQRFYLVPFALFMAFKEERSPFIEYATIALNLAGGIVLYSVNISGRYFF